MQKPSGYNFAWTSDGTTPFYSQFGTNPYASDIVVEAIRCKANEFMKLNPRHIVTRDGKVSADTKSDVHRVLQKPNAYMSTSDLFQNATIMFELTKNCFIYPTWYMTNEGRKHFTGLHVLRPQQATYLVDKSGKYFVQLDFNGGYTALVPKDDVIHWRKDFKGDYFGGNSLGDTSLMRTLQEYDKLLQSIAKSVEVSCQVNSLYKVNTYLSGAKVEAEAQTLSNRIKKTDSGILVTDLGGELTPFSRDIKLVDAETLEFFQNTILRVSGTPLAILNGDYTPEQKQAFYEHSLEAYIISLAQGMTNCFFTDNERAYGNAVALYPAAIEFMSMEQKINYMNVAVPAGALTVDEIRMFGGLAPLAEGGERMPRGYNNIDGTTDETDNTEDTESEDNANE